jgi:hypothetical protein
VFCVASRVFKREGDALGFDYFKSCLTAAFKPKSDLHSSRVWYSHLSLAPNMD